MQCVMSCHVTSFIILHFSIVIICSVSVVIFVSKYEIFLLSFRLLQHLFLNGLPPVMYQSINVDKAAEHVKNIVDSNRCAICDKSTGKRLRYPCGHSGCVDCLSDIESCPLCLTPQDASTFVASTIDEPQTLRSLNAQKLLNAFETVFSVDVNNRNRISEKLKVERELFPQCIQAPVKYYNKRKSAKLSTENKENIKVFPGEDMSSHKMENSNANVRDWLNKCVKRKPFADLNHTITNNRQPLKALNTQNVLLNRSLNKRNYHERWTDENEICSENFHETPIKKKKVKPVKKKVSRPKVVHKSRDDSGMRDDSGIAIDEDEEIIVLDDSQSIKVDKDANALLAVLEAEKNAKLDSEIQNSMFSTINDKLPQHNLKVPFYKKSPLAENCDNCKEYHKAVTKPEEQNVSITVESKSFTAIINISKTQNTNSIKTKQSVEVQTDIKNDANVQIHDNNDGANVDNHSSKSDDIFLGEDNTFSPVASANKSLNVIIAESESDEDLEHSRSLEVTADVHKSYDEMVLGEVGNLAEHGKRPRRIARGHTPTSTDSSEKENYNPNRTKRSTKSKKKPVKK